jgi:RNA polymerase sigma-70 factor (ECF subfamily)
MVGLLTTTELLPPLATMINVDEASSSQRNPPSSGATSRSLLERLKADDASAWETLVGLYGPLVYRWLRRWDLPEHEAADVFQDVFQALAKHIARFRKENAGDTFRGWLRRITENKVRDHLRKLGREPGGEGGTEAQLRLASLPDLVSPEGDESGSGYEHAGLLRAAVELIRGEFEIRTWQAFWLTAVEARSTSDVAVELGMSPGAVRVAKSRVLKRLREELGGL